MSQTSMSWHGRLAQVAWWTASLVFVAWWAGSLWFADPPDVLWTDRDLYRAARVWIDWPTVGAEMNHGTGARVPGGLYLWLMAALRALGLYGYGQFQGVQLATFAAILGVAAGMHRRWGREAAMLTALWLSVPTVATSRVTWMWNPSFVIPTVIGATACLLAARGSHTRRAVWGWSVLLGLGATAHMTVFAWWTVAVLAMAIAAPRWTRRHLAPLLGGMLLCMSPFLAKEAWTGGTQLALLATQSAVQQPTSMHFDGAGTRLVDSATALLPPSTVPALALAAVVVAGLIATTRAPRDDDQDTPLRVATLAPTLVLVCLPAIHGGLQVEMRYLLASSAGIAMAGGLGWAALQHSLPSPVRHVTFAIVVAALSAPMLDVAKTDWRQAWQQTGPNASAHRRLATRDTTLQEAADWADAEVYAIYGRLAILSEQDGTWTLDQPSSARHLLLQAGHADPPGAQPPPCLAMAHKPITEATLAAATTDPDVEVLRTQRLPSGPYVAAYAPSQPGRCKSTLANRYIPTRAERVMRTMWPTLAGGDVQAIPFDDGTMWVTRILEPPHIDITVGVWFSLDGTRRVTLHSHQLRGKSYNPGWFMDGKVEGVELTLQTGPFAHVIPLAPEVLGSASSVHTPYASTLPALPRGAYEVHLRGKVYPVPRRADAAVDASPRPFDLRLTTDLPLPPLPDGVTPIMPPYEPPEEAGAH